MHSFWQRLNRSLLIQINRNGVEAFQTFDEVTSTMLVKNETFKESQLEFCQSVFQNTTDLLKDKVLGDNHPQKVQSLYHLARFVSAGGVIPQKGTILEIGSGVGCIPNLISQLGFQGQYHVVDIESVNLIRDYYLKTNDTQLEIIPNITKGPKVSLMIGLWSISEMTEEERASYLNILPSQAIFAYGSSFEDQDNVEYFTTLQSDLKLNWSKETFGYYPDQTYLFGTKKVNPTKVKE